MFPDLRPDYIHTHSDLEGNVFKNRGRKNGRTADSAPRSGKIADYPCQTENGSWKNRGLSTAFQDMRDHSSSPPKPHLPRTLQKAKLQENSSFQGFHANHSSY